MFEVDLACCFAFGLLDCGLFSLGWFFLFLLFLGDFFDFFDYLGSPDFRKNLFPDHHQYDYYDAEDEYQIGSDPAKVTGQEPADDRTQHTAARHITNRNLQEERHDRIRNDADRYEEQEICGDFLVGIGHESVSCISEQRRDDEDIEAYQPE